MRPLDVAWLGRVPYPEGSALQTSLHQRRGDDEIGDVLLQLEHPHVYTVGRRGQRSDVLWGKEMLARRGVDVHEADRGGQVTYHGPGQIVGYPIVDLGHSPDLVRYVRDLEEAVIRTLAVYGVEGERTDGLSGVWVGLEKIAAVGVRVTRGVTKHGFALNVSPDLEYFSGIVPCGILDRGVTSVEALTGSAPCIEDVADTFAGCFAEVFDREIRVLAEVPA